MENQIKNELDLLTDIILHTIPVEQIILFGSYAGETQHDDSDLDIYVVMQENADIREIDAMRLIRKAIRNKKTMPVDIVVSRASKFNRRKLAPSIERQIAEDGVLLYG